MKILPEISVNSNYLEEIYKDLHSHPELGFEEVRTSQIVQEKLKEYRRWTARDLVLRTACLNQHQDITKLSLLIRRWLLCHSQSTHLEHNMDHQQRPVDSLQTRPSNASAGDPCAISGIPYLAWKVSFTVIDVGESNGSSQTGIGNPADLRSEIISISANRTPGTCRKRDKIIATPGLPVSYF